MSPAVDFHTHKREPTEAEQALAHLTGPVVGMRCFDYSPAAPYGEGVVREVVKIRFEVSYANRSGSSFRHTWWHGYHVWGVSVFPILEDK